MSPSTAGVDVRTQAVSAFQAASEAVHATGDRRVEEMLHQLAVELGHHDTTDETLAGVMQAFAGATGEGDGS